MFSELGKKKKDKGETPTFDLSQKKKIVTVGKRGTAIMPEMVQKFTPTFTPTITVSPVLSPVITVPQAAAAAAPLPYEYVTEEVYDQGGASTPEEAQEVIYEYVEEGLPDYTPDEMMESGAYSEIIGIQDLVSGAFPMPDWGLQGLSMDADTSNAGAPAASSGIDWSKLLNTVVDAAGKLLNKSSTTGEKDAAAKALEKARKQAEAQRLAEMEAQKGKILGMDPMTLLLLAGGGYMLYTMMGKKTARA